MSHELISQEVFAKAIHLTRFKIASSVLMGISGVNGINSLYQHANGKVGINFIEDIFNQLEVSICFDESTLDRIPQKGPFITISNHPFGALDGLILLYIVTKVRPDFKVMANFLLKHVEPIQDYFISVNPFEDKQKLSSSFGGIKTSLQHLKTEKGLGVFPAGEVSCFRTDSLQVTDKRWSKTALKLIRKAKVPIVPIHFQGQNSLLFQFLGIIHPSLRTAALPSEILKKKKSNLHVRIGHPIPVKEQETWKDLDQFGRFLKAKTYALDTNIEVQTFFKSKKKTQQNIPLIAAASDRQKLKQEIEQIQELKINTQAEFETYLAPAHKIPHLLNEIGRLREITFRDVGEGSCKELDIDEYDLYYQHLFLWDKEACELVGAYRLGLGKDIFAAYGKKGFYIESLFRLKKGFQPILKYSLELGRSFVRKEYQKKRLPLFLLWQGIVQFIDKNPHYKYITGPVSISNSYSKLSKMLIVTYIKRFYFDENLAHLIKPRKKFKVIFKKIEGDKLIENLTDDMKQFDKVIADIEPNHAPVPVLIKKYLRQNAKIIGFNQDPKFNNALDGLMILDLEEWNRGQK